MPKTKVPISAHHDLLKDKLIKSERDLQKLENKKYNYALKMSHYYSMDEEGKMNFEKNMSESKSVEEVRDEKERS